MEGTRCLTHHQGDCAPQDLVMSGAQPVNAGVAALTEVGLEGWEQDGSLEEAAQEFGEPWGRGWVTQGCRRGASQAGQSVHFP